ncbi:MAG: non-canonical purine NTP pyrophosphatase [Porticoccaceae bacterium]|nr:MAG: non-canonical purine NTP pyrophosphatase [Porticoccaceae bacterium]
MTLRVVLASHNRGKLRELAALLADLPLELVGQGELGIPPAEETGLSFADNALIKARHAARASGLAALADDSGLAVDHLDGAPGVFSARFAGPGADDAANVRKLLDALAGVPAERRTARFHCAVAFLRHPDDPHPILCEGVWEGRIADRPAGSGGFGYDPVFFVPDLGCTAAELPAAVKGLHSHRARALAALRQRLAETLG